MDLQKLIEIIQESEWSLPSTDKNEIEQRWKLMCPAKALAIEALKKQISQKCECDGNYYPCPRCGTPLADEVGDYCPYCGQKYIK